MNSSGNFRPNRVTPERLRYTAITFPQAGIEKLAASAFVEVPSRRLPGKTEEYSLKPQLEWPTSGGLTLVSPHFPNAKVVTLPTGPRRLDRLS